jgi:hypothetical protein
VHEYKKECNPGELPKFLSHIAEINSVGRAKNENMNHLQGQVAMQAVLLSMKKTSTEHPGFQVIEDRGLLNATADPLGWNVMVAQLYARFVNEDQITTRVIMFQQNAQKTDESLEAYYRRCLALGEGCRTQMGLAAIATKILGGMFSSPAKTELTGRSMQGTWASLAKGAYSDLTAIVLESWLPVARNHVSGAGVAYTEAPKTWDTRPAPQRNMGKGEQPSINDAAEGKETRKGSYYQNPDKVRCGKCRLWHYKADTCDQAKEKRAKLKEGSGGTTQKPTPTEGGKGSGGGN